MARAGVDRARVNAGCDEIKQLKRRVHDLYAGYRQVNGAIH
jgi:hypothetical protein